MRAGLRRKTGGLSGEFRHPEQRENGGVGAVDPETPYPVLGAFAYVERRGDQPVQRILDHGEVVRQRFGLGESQLVARRLEEVQQGVRHHARAVVDRNPVAVLFVDAGRAERPDAVVVGQHVPADELVLAETDQVDGVGQFRGRASGLLSSHEA